MRKGEEKKQEILSVAEQLFCTRGYEETSVQDILDVIHGSKGGFYHYFVSKEDVLRQICAARAQASGALALERLQGVAEPMERLNLALRMAIPLRAEEQTFLAMLIPQLGRPETISVRTVYQEAIAEVFAPLIADEMRQAAAAGAVYPVTEGLEQVVLALLNQCWLHAALLLYERVQRRRRPDAGELLDILKPYRKSIKTLLDAPYGSVELIQLQEWDQLAEWLQARMSAVAYRTNPSEQKRR